MNEIGAVLGCVGVLIVPTLCTWMVARWILGPIAEAAKRGKEKVQYRIIDFFCLVVEMQAVTAVIVAVTERGERGFRGLLLLFGTASVLALWVGGVQTLSRAGILDPRRRTVFNWIVLPAASIGALVLVPLVFYLVGAWIEAATRGRPQPSPLWMWGLAGLLAFALLSSKWLAEWVTAELPPFPPPPRPERFPSRLPPRQVNPVPGIARPDEPVLAEIVEPEPPAAPPPSALPPSALPS